MKQLTDISIKRQQLEEEERDFQNMKDLLTELNSVWESYDIKTDPLDFVGRYKWPKKTIAGMLKMARRCQCSILNC
jgi:hypothetical protein